MTIYIHKSEQNKKSYIFLLQCKAFENKLRQVMFYVWLAVYILIHTRYDYEEKTNNSGKIII